MTAITAPLCIRCLNKPAKARRLCSGCWQWAFRNGKLGEYPLLYRAHVLGGAPEPTVTVAVLTEALASYLSQKCGMTCPYCAHTFFVSEAARRAVDKETLRMKGVA